MDVLAAAAMEQVRANMRRVRITACHPTRAFFRPGEAGAVRFSVSSTRLAPLQARVRVVDLNRTVVTAETVVEGPEQTISFPLPAVAGKGYGVKLSLMDQRTGQIMDHTRTAIDVHDSWVDAPRYGFLSEFAPDEQYGERGDQLLSRHITVVQLYDWMYRHYQFLPPSDTFTDALGRILSLSSTRRAVATLRKDGIASMAYGAIYGAEPEYALQHPDELLYDQSGTPISLDGAFYLQDVRPGPWRDRILNQYRQTVSTLEVNGIHADQYGFPEQARDADGGIVEMAPALAGMVAAAQQAVTGAGGDGIIFNCVTNWPIQAVAPEPQLCTYIEVWPPYTCLRDLHDLVTGAKALAPQRQVILAAYMSCAAVAPDAAETATLLASAAIHASGGFHLLLGEGTGMLVDPYYPKFVRPGRHFQQRIMSHWDFIVRYGAYLFDRSLTFSPEVSTRSRGLWLIRRVAPTFDTVSVINADPGDPWDVAKVAPRTRSNVTIEMSAGDPVKAVFVASPDGTPDAVPIDFEQSGMKLRFTIPRVRTWSLAIVTR